MPFSVSWSTLLEELEELPYGATLIAPLSHNQFRVTDVLEHRVIIEFQESGESQPLQRDQFGTMYHRIQDELDGFELSSPPVAA